MSKEQQMNGADAPETGSKMPEANGTDAKTQFPASDKAPKHDAEHKSTHRILSFNDFEKDKIEKFNKQTIDKEAMSGPKEGDKGVATLESEEIDEAVTIKNFAEFSAGDQEPIEPVEPSEPAAPEAPTPAEPSEPATPAEPSEPAEPATPAEPSEPAAPEAPTPSNTTISGFDDFNATPAEPSEPEPATPTEPEK